MIDDASAKVSDANAGDKSRMADRERHGAVNSSHDCVSGPAQGPRPEDEHGYGYRVVTVGEAVESAVSGEWDIPEFQRQFVWQPSQVCGLVDSLWRNYPIGALLLAQRKQRRRPAPIAMVDRRRPAAAYLLVHFVRPRTGMALAQTGRVPHAPDETIRPLLPGRRPWPARIRGRARHRQGARSAPGFRLAGLWRSIRAMRVAGATWSGWPENSKLWNATVS
jgi:hypothetical protein